MKQTLVLAVLSFLVSAASGTWFATNVAPPRAAVVDRPRDWTGAADPPKRAPAARRGEVVMTGADTVKAPTPPPPPPPVSPPNADTAGDGSRAKAVSKILAAMKPKAAADIAARLTDEEVERIVRQLNPKQVAALLAALPEERAALLSRRLLEPKTGRQRGT